MGTVGLARFRSANMLFYRCSSQVISVSSAQAFGLFKQDFIEIRIALPAGPYQKILRTTRLLILLVHGMYTRKLYKVKALQGFMQALSAQKITPHARCHNTDEIFILTLMDGRLKCLHVCDFSVNLYSIL